MAVEPDRLRNVGIVAHVDHGKTTLVDHMLRQAGVFREGAVVEERILDCVDQERERGITILAKNASVRWQGWKINLVDTPGHADFGGEVERSLRLVDGVLLLVDAAEGPLPQTRFVLSKVMDLGLPSIVVINKVDRKDARATQVLDEVYDLYIDLGASDAQIEFPVLYAVAREGKADWDPDAARTGTRGLAPLFEAIVEHLPAPRVEPAGDLALLVANLDHDDYVGRLAIGRVESGRIDAGSPVVVWGADGARRSARVGELYTFEGMDRRSVSTAPAGELVAVSGLKEVAIGDTVSAPHAARALPRVRVDPPTLAMVFRANDGPFAGREGTYVTSRQLRERLFREAYRNVAIEVEEGEEPDAFRVCGRGELQLAVLIESMRREGYEMTVSNPEPLLQERQGEIYEPYECIVCDLPEIYVGAVTQILGPRRGVLQALHPAGSGRVRVTWRVPSRGLIGLRPLFLTETRGEGILHAHFDGYDRWAGEITHRSSGALVADREGEAVAYALFNLQDRGTLFIAPGTPVYTGMVVGEHARSNDLDVNVCRTKKLTNIRAAGKDENVVLTPPREMGLEAAIEWIRFDELVEATPEAIRIRKRLLDPQARHRAARDRKLTARRGGHAISDGRAGVAHRSPSAGHTEARAYMR
ncbi:MAG: translational GTPase TypA [Deltaproteobacteria bacterium]|nr:MAG: translational GTPase TypA [Deltaproteobacteria bacterium]